jgi:hypothetical protein
MAKFTVGTETGATVVINVAGEADPAAAPPPSTGLDERLGGGRHRTRGFDLQTGAVLDRTGMTASGGTDAIS